MRNENIPCRREIILNVPEILIISFLHRLTNKITPLCFIPYLILAIVNSGYVFIEYIKNDLKFLLFSYLFWHMSFPLLFTTTQRSLLQLFIFFTKNVYIYHSPILSSRIHDYKNEMAKYNAAR